MKKLQERLSEREREKERENANRLMPNKSGLDPDKTSHNAEQSRGYHNARRNHEGCLSRLIRDSTHLPLVLQTTHTV